MQPGMKCPHSGVPGFLEVYGETWSSHSEIRLKSDSLAAETNLGGTGLGACRSVAT